MYIVNYIVNHVCMWMCICMRLHLGVFECDWYYCCICAYRAQLGVWWCPSKFPILSGGARLRGMGTGGVPPCAGRHPWRTANVPTCEGVPLCHMVFERAFLKINYKLKYKKLEVIIHGVQISCRICIWF